MSVKDSMKDLKS